MGIGASPAVGRSRIEGVLSSAALLSTLNSIGVSSPDLIVTGSGVLWSRAEDDLRAFVDATGIPFFTTPQGRGVVAEDDHEVTFEFATPYIIAATPPDDRPWGVYEPGCRNGLVLRGKADCTVSVSTDHGATWSRPVTISA